MIYISDVSDSVGALHYVTKQDAAAVLGEGAILASVEQQTELKLNSADSTGGIFAGL